MLSRNVGYWVEIKLTWNILDGGRELSWNFDIKVVWTKNKNEKSNCRSRDEKVILVIQTPPSRYAINVDHRRLRILLCPHSVVQPAADTDIQVRAPGYQMFPLKPGVGHK